MSWLVQNLLRDRVKIHTTGDIDSDEFNDLLAVEKKIDELSKLGVINEEELSVLEFVSNGKSMSNTIRHNGKDRHYTSKVFRSVCNKLSFYLGGYFTDEGYVSYMKKKYNLTDKQIETMIAYMTNKHKYKIIRKQKHVE